MKTAQLTYTTEAIKMCPVSSIFRDDFATFAKDGNQQNALVTARMLS